MCPIFHQSSINSPCRVYNSSYSLLTPGWQKHMRAISAVGPSLLFLEMCKAKRSSFKANAVPSSMEAKCSHGTYVVQCGLKINRKKDISW
ncbi:hypothetical protein Tco_0451548 [Tanacetum coccineum]